MIEPPLAELKESQATGRIAEIYDDLRFTLRVPMVNLIFRHFATVPGCLEWFWACVGPLYVSGKLTTAANELCAELTIPDLALPPQDCGLDGASRQAVLVTCDAYARANPANLLALRISELLLNESGFGTQPSMPDEDTVPRAKAVALNMLPPMGDLDRIPRDARLLLEQLSIQVHGEEGPVIPSFYRHFVAWPSFLKTLHMQLPTILPTINADVAAIEHAAHAKAKLLHAKHTRSARQPPSADAISALRSVLGRFPANLCRMTLIALAIKAALSGLNR